MTTLTLPLPPSTNALTRNTSAAERQRFAARGFKARSRVKTHAYKAWQTAAGWRLRIQRPISVHGAVDVMIAVAGSAVDVDNRAKALLDLLVLHRVIDDDRHVREIRVREVADKTFGPPPGQCVVTVVAAVADAGAVG